MNEEIVVILDASRSMGEEFNSYSNDRTEDFLGTTKLDVAQYVTQQLLLRADTPCGPLQDQTKVLALVTLGGDQSMAGEKRNGDFVEGIHSAANAMCRLTTIGAARRRIVLVTDARQKVLQATPNEPDPMEALAETINRLSEIGCQLEVVGIGFSREKFVNRVDRMGDFRPEVKETICKTEADSEDEQDESDDESSEEEDDDDWSDIQDQNELLLVDLVDKLGGCVLAVNGDSFDDDKYGIHAALKQLTFSSEIGVAVKAEGPVDHSEKSNIAGANCAYTIEVLSL